MLLHYLHYSCPPKCSRPYHSSPPLLPLSLLAKLRSFVLCLLCVLVCWAALHLE
ncbi:hypothetical protein OIU76_019906 [Salix suchowensis]|nr:hypothetical protein OIU76_019906 [Salix suchowensis]